MSSYFALMFLWLFPVALGAGSSIFLSLMMLIMSLISDFLVDWRRHQNRFSCLTKWWEACKDRMKGLSINYGVAKSCSNCGQHDLLVRLAEHLKVKLDQG